MTLSATSNNKTFHKYAFDTNENFKSDFLKILNTLNFEEKKIKDFWTRKVQLEESDKSYEGEEFQVTPKITFFQDTFHRLENKNCHIEIFIGKKKIFLIIRLKREKEKTRKKLVNYMHKQEWITPEEAENRKWEKEKKLQTYLPNKIKTRISSCKLTTTH